ncbi:MAG: metal ABC transporter permease [Coriobacteriales bacterium]|jgi:zinc transport system permease protein|nr:metal ABC transporter permease [Coriobacteriales bacterium]
MTDFSSALGGLGAMFAYTFVQRALLVGLLVSICAALLGTSLVLKRYSMIGDGLSHVGFGSLAVATALGAAPLAVALPVTVVAAFLLLRLTEQGKLKGDAAIALLSASAVAIGVFVISMTTGMNTDVDNFLFGSILALNEGDVVLSSVLCAVVLVLFVLFYNRIFAVTFDEVHAQASGIRTGLYSSLLAVLTAFTIVVGMRMMGALLISSLVVFPVLSAMCLRGSFKAVTVLAACLSVACYLIGIMTSFMLATPTGASIVIINLCAYLVCRASLWARGRVRRT